MRRIKGWDVCGKQGCDKPPKYHGDWVQDGMTVNARACSDHSAVLYTAARQASAEAFVVEIED